MKRFITIGALLLMVLSFALTLTAQTPADVTAQGSATFTRGQAASAYATAEMYNLVTFTKRDCSAYASEHRGGLLWLHKRTVIDVEGCNADASTVSATWTKHNLTTNAGKDFIKAQISGTGTTANCIYMAVGTSAVTPAAADTTLTGETTANGMNNGGTTRWTGTYASTGTGTFTLTKVFTATGAVSGVQAAAVFTAASAGTMCFEVGSLGPVTLANTDTLTVTWSGTVS